MKNALERFNSRKFVLIYKKKTDLHSKLFLFADYSESLGSEEESGKDWDELEEEARKGLLFFELVNIRLWFYQLHSGC